MSKVILFERDGKTTVSILDHLGGRDKILNSLSWRG
jgi:hypothetical protein